MNNGSVGWWRIAPRAGRCAFDENKKMGPPCIEENHEDGLQTTVLLFSLLLWQETTKGGALPSLRTSEIKMSR